MCFPDIGGDLFSGISYGGWACQEGKVCIQPSAPECDVSSGTDCEEAVSIKADENSGVAWFSPEEALKKSTEPWFVERVYAKLIEKTKKERCQ